MKKLVALFLTGLLAFSLTGCNSGGGTSDKPLVVATMEMNGDFITGFGNSSYDKDVRNMIWGLETVSTDFEGAFIVNDTVVKSMEEKTNDDGSKTFTFEINDGLKWSDDQPVTAKDYVFSLLWSASPEWLAAGADDASGDSLVGYSEYYDGSSENFKGVHLIDDKKFSLTIASENLPYFYEWSYVSVIPKPLHSYFPGGSIESTEEAGAKLTGGDLAQATADVAANRSAPTVTSGPYLFESYENNQVVLKINDKFPGDYEGNKPTIGEVNIKVVNATTDVDLLLAGEVDIVAGVVEGDKIEKALEDSSVQNSTYARNGYGNVQIHTDFGATAIPEVRRAINYVIDKDAVIQNVLGGYGSSVSGNFGKAQWMYQVNKEAVDQLESYAFSIDKANAELDNTDYKFEADGTTPWDAAKAVDATDYYRYNASGEVLEVKHLGTNDNTVTDALEVSFNQNYPKVGVKFSLTRTDFAGLLDAYYEGTKKDPSERYNTFNMATSFTPVYDPYYSFYSEYAGTRLNPVNIKDAELDEYIIEMRELSPTQKDEYAAAWLKFQTRFNEILPNIPVYANQYYDFADADLENFVTGPMKNWSEIMTTLKWK